MALLKRKRLGLNDAMSVVTRFVNACNRHDSDGVAACLHSDFDSIQPMFPSRNFRGADQVRRNWQAIFDAEPGFRLTVLRSAAMDDTVWLELHGAGRDAEVAGIFIMGIVGDRIRWARIYSALVEPMAAGEDDGTSAGLHQVRPLDEAPPVGGEVVEEALIAPVLDIDRSGRRRRRRRTADDAAEAAEAAPGEAAVTDAPGLGVDASQPEASGWDPDGESVPEPEADVMPEAGAGAGAGPEVQVEAGAEVEIEPVVVVEIEADAGAEAAHAVNVVEIEPVDVVGIEPVEVVEIEPAEEQPVEGQPVDGGLDTEAVPVIVWDDDAAEPETAVIATDPAAEAAPVPSAEPAGATQADEAPARAPAPEPHRRRFGKRRD